MIISYWRHYLLAFHESSTNQVPNVDVSISFKRIWNELVNCWTQAECNMLFFPVNHKEFFINWNYKYKQKSGYRPTKYFERCT